jgi:hypothetical protein
MSAGRGRCLTGPHARGTVAHSLIAPDGIAGRNPTRRIDLAVAAVMAFAAASTAETMTMPAIYR